MTVHANRIDSKQDELAQMRASDEGMPLSAQYEEQLESGAYSELKGVYERYFGVCDVYSPEEAAAMAEGVRKERKNQNRKVMIGVMTHPIVLNPDLPVPQDVRTGVSEVFPTKEQLADGFIDDPDVLNTVHYADLYGPNGPRKTEECPDVFQNLELVVKYGGEYLHAIQLDLTWPKSEEIKKFKEKNPNIFLILQVGKFALKEVGGDLDAVVDRLKEYDDSIDYILLDMSMGMGKGMATNELLPVLRKIRKELPYLGLAVAGGLGPDSVDLLKPIADEFPDVSIDAQGNLKLKDAPRDNLGHLVATHPADLGRSQEYIQQSCAVLDNQTK